MVDTYSELLPNGDVRLSGEAARLILESHAIAARAMLISEDGATQELPLVAGSVSADSSSIIRRSATLDVFGTWSDDVNSLLNPYGGPRIRIERGIRLDSGFTEWVPLVTGRITDISSSSDDKDSLLKLTVKDDMFTIKQDRFDVTTTTNTAEKVVDAIKRLLQETLPNRTFSDFTESTDMCGELDLQRDRADGIAKLATSIGAECYTTRDGMGFILRPSPSFADTPRWQLGVGDRGNVISVERSRSAEGTYNRVYAYGESNEATGVEGEPPPAPPVSAAAVISDITDPLYYGGPFGKVTRFYKSPLLTTTEQAQGAADSLLEKARGRNYEISFVTLVNPAVEPGDVVLSQISDGVKRLHAIDTVSLPLAPSDTQSLSVRTIALPEEST